MPSLLLIQWGLVGFFVIIHFIIGFFRGTIKSTYYTLVSIVLSLFVLLVVSGISLGNYIEVETLIDLIQSNTSNAIPLEYVDIISQPEVIGYVFAILDVIVRIVAFIVLYTLIRFVLTFVVFGLIWNLVLKNKVNEWFKLTKVIVKGDQDIEQAEVLSKKYKTTQDRLGGAFIGAFRGLITTFILLLPILVLATTTENLSFSNFELLTQETQLSNDQNLESVIPSEIVEIVEMINELNGNNFSRIFGNLGNTLFDFAFETNMGSSKFNLRDELNIVTKIIDIAHDKGYLDSNFDFESISFSDTNTIKEIIALISNSQLITQGLSIGSDVLVAGLLEDELGFSFEGRLGDDSFNTLATLDWSLELNQLAVVIEKVLNFGSVAQLLDLANDADSILELTQAQATKLADVLRAVADLQLVKLVGAGVDYATSLEDAQSLIEWLPENEREDYLQEILVDLISNTEFFYGEDGDLYNLANLLEVIFGEYGDFALSQLLEDDLDIEAILIDDVQAFAEATLQSLAQVETLTSLLPLAVDFALYGVLDATDAAVLSDDLNEALQNLDLSDEFNNLTDIYQTIIQLGVSRFLAEDSDLIALLDDIVENNLDDVRTLVDQVFVKSVLVNALLENGVSIAFDLALETSDLKTLLESVLFDDGEFVINIGSEIVALFDVLEALLEITDLTTLNSTLADGDLLLAFIDDLGSNHVTDAQLVVEKIFDLQLVSRLLNHAFDDLLTFILEDASQLEAAMMLVDDGALLIDLESDIIDILDIIGLGYTFTSVSGLLDATGELNIDTAVALADAFGSVSIENALLLVDLLTGLELIGALNNDVLSSLASLAGFDTLYLANDLDLAAELTNLLMPVYITAHFVHEALKTDEIQDVDFGPLLEQIKPYFLASENNQLLVQNFAYNLESLVTELQLEDFIYVPRILAAASPESQDWKDEYNVLFSTIFNFLEVLSQEVTISNQKISNITGNLTTYNVLNLLELFNSYEKVENVFGPLLNSKIVRGSIPVITKSFEDVLSGTIDNLMLSIPELALDNDMLKEDALLDVIAPILSILFDGMENAKFLSIQDALDAVNELDAFEIYDFIYGTNAEDFEALAASDLIRGFISQLIFDDAVIDFAQSILEDALDINLTQAFRLQRTNNLLTVEELQAVFTIVHDLALPKSLILRPDSRINLLSDAVFGYIQSLGEDEFVVLFDNYLINDILTSVLKDPGLAAYAQALFDDNVGATLDALNVSLGLTPGLNLDVEGFVEGFVSINNEFGHLDLRELVPFIVAYQTLDINRYADLFTFNTVDDFIEAYNALESDVHILAALNSRFIKYPLGFILSDEVFAQSITTIVNGFTTDLGHTFATNAFAFDDYLFESNGDLKVEYISQMVAAAFAILNLDQGFTIDALLGLGEEVKIFGQTETILDHILNVEILFQIIDKITIEKEVLSGLAKVLETVLNDLIVTTGMDTLLEENGLSSKVYLTAYALPNIALDSNGRFSRDEIRTLLNIFIALDMTTFEELSVLSTTQGIYDTIKNTELVEAILTSKVLNYFITTGLNNPALYQGLASLIEDLIFDQFNVLVDINPSIFNISEAKYNIFDTLEDGSLKIKASEVRHLLLSILSVDFADVTFGSGLEVIDGVYALLELKDENNVSLIDNILQSRIVLALFDKLLNLETDASNLKPVITAILNRLFADYLDGNLLDNNILDMRNITTDDGVIAASEIKALLYLGKLIDSQSSIGLGLVFDLFTKDNNNNQKGDFEDIFSSNIVLSIVSNLVANTSIRNALTSFIEISANETLSSIALFNGFEFDGSSLNLIFEALTDDNGSFDYSEIRRLFNVVGALGIVSEEKLNNLDIADLLDNMLLDLYEADFDGKNGIRYLAESNLLRALIDALILEQDSGYAWGIQTILGLLTDDVPTVNPDSLTMATEMRALDDENGLVKFEHVYDFLLAILAQDLISILGFNGDLDALVRGFNDKPLAGINQDRIGFLYNSEIIEILLSGIVDDYVVEASISTLVSDIVIDVLSELGFETDIALFGYEDLGITFDLFNESAIRQLLKVVDYLDVRTYAQLEALSDPYVLFAKLEFPLTNTKMIELIEIPLINHTLKVFLDNENLDLIIQDVINQFLRLYSINVFVESPILGLPFDVTNTDLLELIQSIYIAGLFDFENYGLLSIEFFTDLLDSNIVFETGEDDFDRVLSSRILYVLLNNLLLIDEIQDIIVEYSTIYLDMDLSSIDFTMPSSVIGLVTNNNIESIEVGRITKDAWRELFVAIRALNIDEVLSEGTLGLQVVTDLVDLSNQQNDALSTFLASDIVYAYIARILSSEEINSLVVEMLPEELLDLLGDFSILAPVDALNTTGDFIGLFSRAEIYALIRSLKYLNIDIATIDANVLSYIFALVDSNIASDVDDFDRFIASKYMQDKLSNILLSDEIIDLISQDLFTVQDFFDTLPDVALLTIEAYSRLAEQEYRNLFVALQTLGLTDLSNVDFGVDNLTALSEVELNTVLASEYVYTLIHLILDGQDAIEIPASAYETTGNYEGMIKKSEIINILKALDILGGDLDNIDVNDLTIADLQDLFDLNSALVDSLLEEGLATVLTIPDEAYVTGTLNRDEISQTIAVLLVLANNDATTRLSAIDVANLTFTVTLIQSIQTAAPDSHIIDNLLSEALLEALDVPARAIDQTLSYDYVAISPVIDALNILGITTLDSNVSVDGVTIAKYQALVALESFIIDRLLSGIILGSGLDIPTASLDTLGDTAKDITRSELDALGDALLILNNNDSTGVVDTVLDGLDPETLSPAMLEDLLELNSPLINRLVASGIIATNLVKTEHYAVLGDSNFDPNAVDQDLKVSEMNHIASSLVTLGVQNLSEITSLTFEQIQGLTDDQIDLILGGTTTFMYYVIEDVIDSVTPSLVEQYNLIETIDIVKVNDLITKTDLITLVKYDFNQIQLPQV